ncbi:hypothetical protein [Leptospira interrogans]|nr:hypothetical protein [Leptospira interrogans]
MQVLHVLRQHVTVQHHTNPDPPTQHTPILTDREYPLGQGRQSNQGPFW